MSLQVRGVLTMPSILFQKLQHHLKHCQDLIGFHWLIFGVCLFVLVFKFIFLIGLQHRFGSAIWFLKSSCSWAGRCVYSVALNLLRKKGSHPIIEFCLQTTALSPCPLWDTQRLPSALLRLRDKWQQQNHSNFSSSFSPPLLLDPAGKSREWTQVSSSCSPRLLARTDCGL